MDPDPDSGGTKTCGFGGSGSGSVILHKIVKSSQKYGFGSGIRKKLNSDPGVKKAPDPGSTLRSTLTRIYFFPNWAFCSWIFLIFH